jgi:tRNA dimethylallyltransferase
MAARLRPRDRQRLIRAAEVLEATGRSLADWQRETKPACAGGGSPGFRTVLVDPPRDALYAACDARFLAMIERGVLDEVGRLARRDLDPSLPGLKALGLPALLAHWRGEVSLEEAIGQGQGATRRYAKRQATWFRHQFIAGYSIREKFSEYDMEEFIPIIIRFFLTDNS